MQRWSFVDWRLLRRGDVEAPALPERVRNGALAISVLAREKQFSGGYDPEDGVAFKLDRCPVGERAERPS